MKIVAKSILGMPTYFVGLIPLECVDASNTVRMCSNPKKATNLTKDEAEKYLVEVLKCYPSAMIIDR